MRKVSKSLLTLKDVKERLKEINPNIEIISKEYINSRSKLLCRCLIDGYEWEVTWNHLRNGRGCPKCRGGVRLSLNHIKNEIYLKNPNIEILSDEYINHTSKLKLKCKLDGYIWETTWQSLQQGAGCPKCAKNLPLNLEKIKNILKENNPNITVISNYYKNNQTKLRCKCLVDNYEWNTDWAYLSNHAYCPVCMGYKTNYTLDDVKEYLKSVNASFEVISDVYISISLKLKFRCLKDGHVWENSFSNILRGNGCPKCSPNAPLSEESLKDKILELNPNIAILPSKLEGYKTKLRLKCLKDDFEWSVSYLTFRQAPKCPKCNPKKIGNKHWNWLGGISHLSYFLRQHIIEWKKDSMKISNYKCVITGENFKDVHHLDSFNVLMQKVLDNLDLDRRKQFKDYNEQEIQALITGIKNEHKLHPLGVCLTKEEHKLFHSIYGYGKNTKQQFDEFVEMRKKEGVFCGIYESSKWASNRNEE